MAKKGGPPFTNSSFIAEMLFALMLALIAIVGGALVTYLYDEGAPVAARLCAGACIGFAALGLFGFVFASLLGLTALTLVLSALVVASPLALLIKQKRRAVIQADFAATIIGVRRAILHPKRETIPYLIFYTLVALVLWLVFDRAMFEQGGNIYTGAINNYGDLPFHLSVITRFAYGDNFPPEDPTFAGARFTYPFLADLVAAMFVRAGASLRGAMLMENFVLGLAFVGLLHRWASVLVRDTLAALLTPVLVLLSGGLGWWLLFDEASEGQDFFAMLMRLPHDYTLLPETTWRWANSLSSLLVPQRAMLLGLPLAIVIFTQWWTANEREGEGGKGKGERRSAKGRKAKGAGQKLKAESSTTNLSPFTFPLSPSAKRMFAAGVVAGLLPLAHAHSFLVVMMVGACLALLTVRERWREWAVFFIVASVVAAPQLWWVTRGSAVRTGSFIGWHFGWDRGDENVVWFWLKNTGLFIPLIVAAAMWRDKKGYLVPRPLLLFYLPFTLCFIVPNLVKLAPWVWDNIKVLFYWYIASAPLVALLLARLWRGGLAYRLAAVALLISLTLAGGLDVWRIVSKSSEYGEFDREGIAFAEMIRQNTVPRALVLHAPTFNHPVALTGRRSLMGYPGHIWTHGIEYAPREAEIKRIYAGARDAEELMARYGVEYIVLSHLERSLMPVNEQFFERYTKVGETGEYRLYKIARP